MKVETDKYKLYRGDCLEVMDELIKEDILVDAIITDPPYGTTACKWDSIIPFNTYIVVKEGKRYKTLYKDEFMLKKFKEGINIKEAEKEWEENSKEGMWDKINKLIKDNSTMLFFASQPYCSKLIHSNIDIFRHEWIWQKDKSGNFMNCKFEPMKIHEHILVFGRQKGVYNPIMELREEKNKRNNKPRINTSNIISTKKFETKESRGNSDYKYPTSIKKFNSVRNGVHPTQKPVDLLEYLIKTYTSEGDLVLDFTMGSGSTGVACLNTNRRFIGIELDEKYFNIAKQRLENIK